MGFLKKLIKKVDPIGSKLISKDPVGKKLLGGSGRKPTPQPTRPGGIQTKPMRVNTQTTGGSQSPRVSSTDPQQEAGSRSGVGRLQKFNKGGRRSV